MGKENRKLAVNEAQEEQLTRKIFLNPFGSLFQLVEKYGKDFSGQVVTCKELKLKFKEDEGISHIKIVSRKVNQTEQLSITSNIADEEFNIISSPTRFELFMNYLPEVAMGRYKRSFNNSTTIELYQLLITMIKVLDEHPDSVIASN